MTTTSSFTIARAAESSDDSSSGSSCPSLTLEQPGFSTGSNTVTMAQLVAMVNAARNGESAWSVLRDACKYVTWDAENEGLMHVAIPFYAMPSTPEMDFTVTATPGVVLSSPQRVSLTRTVDAVFTNSSSVQLDYCFETGTAVQLIPAFTADGDGTTVSATLSGSTLTLSSEATTAFRISGTVVAYKYNAKFDLDRTPQATVVTMDEDGNEISRNSEEVWMTLDSPSIAILATWLCATDDEWQQKTASLTLNIPDCVESMLTVCPDTDKTKVQSPADPVSHIVYYSGCDGKVVEDREVDA